MVRGPLFASCVLALLVVEAFAYKDPTTTETGIDGEVIDMRWLDEDRKIVFVHTAKRSIYRSDNEGLSWRKPRLDGVDIPAENGRTGVAHMYISPVDDSHVFLMGQGRKHWMSTDHGATFTSVETPTNVDISSSTGTGLSYTHLMQLHPTNPKKVLAALASPGCQKAPHENCFRQLFASDDFGLHWYHVADYVIQFSWANETGESDLPESALYLTQWDSAARKGNQVVANDERISFIRFKDVDAPVEENLLSACGGFAFVGEYLFAAVYDSKSRESRISLWVSKNDGESFSKAQMPPHLDLEEHGYHILDTSSGAVFLHVAHGDWWGNIYESDSNGLRYVLSLEHTHNVYGIVDFERLRSLEGVFVANTVHDMDAANPFQLELTSKISFDNGGEWEPIRAPEVNADGTPIICHYPSCSLHLAGYAERFQDLPAFYSAESAVGLMLATGNYGSSLSRLPEDVNTYLSRDGGVSWEEIKKGSYIYEFGDHGGIIVLVKNQEPTDRIEYSLDEGKTFNSVQFSTEGPVEVSNVIIEPSATSSQFVIYGYRNEGSDRVGVLVHLDFTNTWPRKCSGADAPDTRSSDYETWSPHDGARDDNDPCVLGRKTTYTRRKRSADCYNGQELERESTPENCPCADDDWECDFDYEPADPYGNGASPCLLVGPPPSKDPPADCPAGTQYPVTNGYRKVAGDTCDATRGVNKGPTMLDCPAADDSGVFGGGSAGTWLLVIFLILVVVGAVTGCFIYRERVQEILEASGISSPFSFGPVTGAVRSPAASNYGRVDDNGPDTIGLDDDDDHDLISSPHLLGEDDIQAGMSEPAPLPTTSAPAAASLEDAPGRAAGATAAAAVPALQPPRKQAPAATKTPANPLEENGNDASGAAAAPKEDSDSGNPFDD